MRGIPDIAELFSELDRHSAFHDRAERISAWIERLPSVVDAHLVCSDRVNLGPDDHQIIRIPSNHTRRLPSDVAVVNGKSPIPRHIFPEHTQDSVTVVAPFFDTQGDLSGALLIKSSSPKLFVRRFDDLLRVVGSKARDSVELAALRHGGGRGRSVHNDDLITPKVFGKLMDMLNLPMYVLSPTGEFVAANHRFLEEFGFVDLEELNSRPEIFLQDRSWGDQIRRITAEGLPEPSVTKIRTGDDHIRTVQDYAMLVGKETMGVVLDVTDYVDLTERLQDALEAQTKFSDKLTATTSLLQKTQATAMKSLAKLAEYRDKETGGHLQRICEYMKLLAIDLHKAQPFNFNIADDYMEDIYISGMLHDIGKVGVPDQILLKPGKLDKQEWDVMKKHTSWGHSILSQADHELGEQSFLTLASQIALHHHEWYDGTGYPVGSRGEQIPLSARIGAIADVYDALTSRRPYKEAWAHDRAVNEIRSSRGTQFDPVVVDAFVDLESTFFRVRQRFPDDVAPVLSN